MWLGEVGGGGGVWIWIPLVASWKENLDKLRLDGPFSSSIEHVTATISASSLPRAQQKPNDIIISDRLNLRLLLPQRTIKSGNSF